MEYTRGLWVTESLNKLRYSINQKRQRNINQISPIN